VCGISYWYALYIRWWNKVMAKLSEALKIAFKLEHGTDDKALHKNSTENGLTFCGIYETANPLWIGWEQVKKILSKHNGDTKKASLELMSMTSIITAVEVLYKGLYWNKIKGDEILSQKIANEIFIFGINTGMSTAIKTAQRCIGVNADGIIGNETLKALNEFNENKFDMLFDDLEISYYKFLATKNPKLDIYLRGWENRAKLV